MAASVDMICPFPNVRDFPLHGLGLEGRQAATVPTRIPCTQWPLDRIRVVVQPIRDGQHVGGVVPMALGDLDGGGEELGGRRGDGFVHENVGTLRRGNHAESRLALCHRSPHAVPGIEIPIYDDFLVALVDVLDDFGISLAVGWTNAVGNDAEDLPERGIDRLDLLVDLGVCEAVEVRVCGGVRAELHTLAQSVAEVGDPWLVVDAIVVHCVDHECHLETALHGLVDDLTHQVERAVVKGVEKTVALATSPLDAIQVRGKARTGRAPDVKGLILVRLHFGQIRCDRVG